MTWRSGGLLTSGGVTSTNPQPSHQPSLLAPIIGTGQGAGQRLKAINIMCRAKAVDMGQQRLHALRLGLEALPAEQRVQPDQLARREMQPLRLLGQPVRSVAVESDGDQQDHRALGQHPPRPAVIKCVQRRPSHCTPAPLSD